MAETPALPLAGFRVVDLTANVLGPYATQMLGDAGAEVIKVEAAGGDPMRHVGPMRSPAMGSMFANLNRNKQSVVLDLKQPEELALLREMIARADIFVHTVRPAAINRLGLDYVSLAKQFPRLIYASASGYKRGTAEQDDPAFDDSIQGRSGLAWLNRDAEGTPRYLPTIIADKYCGHALAHAITLAALHRERTGEGQEVRLPMMDVMTAFNLVEHLWGATICEPDQGLGYTRMLSPHRRPYATRDGYICVIAVNDSQWARLFAAIGQPDLALDPRYGTLDARARNIDAILGFLAEVMRGRTTDEWLTVLALADIPATRVNSLEDLVADPYLAQSGLLQPVDHPTEGPMLQISPPVELSRSPLTVRSLPPRLDQDGPKLRAEAAAWVKDAACQAAEGAGGRSGKKATGRAS